MHPTVNFPDFEISFSATYSLTGNTMCFVIHGFAADYMAGKQSLKLR